MAEIEECVVGAHPRLLCQSSVSRQPSLPPIPLPEKMGNFVSRIIIWVRNRWQASQAFEKGRAAYDAYKANPTNTALAEECIRSFRIALSLYPEDHRNRPIAHFTFAMVQYSLSATGAEVDVPEAIEQAQKAVDLLKSQTPPSHHQALYYLGLLYRSHFNPTKDDDSCEQSIKVLTELVNDKGSPISRKAVLIELGVSEWVFCDALSPSTPAQRTTLINQLNNAVLHLREAATLIADRIPQTDDPPTNEKAAKPTPADARCLFNLGNALSMRHRYQSRPEARDADLNDAIDAYNRAREILPESPEALIGLARALSTRNQNADAQDAVQYAQTVVDTLGPDDKRYATFVPMAHRLLGLHHRNEYQASTTKNIQDLRQADEHFSEVLKLKPNDADVLFWRAALKHAIVEHEGDKAATNAKQDRDEAAKAIEAAKPYCAGDPSRATELEKLEKDIHERRRGSKPTRMGSLDLVPTNDLPNLSVPKDNPKSPITEEPESISDPE